MKLALGTVQFGTAYGVANREGRPSETEVGAILQRAAAIGMRLFDTAPAYGDSESCLGRSLGEDPPFGFVTKTPRMRNLDDVMDNERGLAATFRRSLDALGGRRLYGLLIHNPEDATGDHGEAAIQEMQDLKAHGLVEKIGVSVYDPADTDRIGPLDALDIVQLPLNVFDQRFLAQGVLRKLKAAGIEIHARSAFLQGLLVMAPDALPPYFAPARRLLTQFHNAARDMGATPLQAALGFLHGTQEIDHIVVGVQSLGQFDEVIAAAAETPSLDYAAFSIDDRSVTDPRQWPSFH